MLYHAAFLQFLKYPETVTKTTSTSAFLHKFPDSDLENQE